MADNRGMNRSSTRPAALPAAETIEHLPQQRRFRLVVDGLPCVADYRIEGGELLLTHTGVPVELRGRGIAARLVQAVVDHARAQGLTLVPVCSYAAAYLRRQAGA
jgi:predicted GNAT family acetyltransferase